jgi:ribonuclease HI
MSQPKRKYYAVLRGKVPGIYTAWFGAGGAEEQVRGYAGAVYKGFPNLQDAKDFMSGRSPAAARKAPERTRSDASSVHLPAGEYISIFTDGGCINNPGPGGYGAVIIDGEDRRELSGGFRLTTNNRMELTACIVALRSLRKRSSAVLTTDSRYVVNGIEKGWARRWRSRNWMRDKTHRAENSDLWGQLLEILEQHEVSFQWVRGHSGHPENERCDLLARTSALMPGLPEDAGYEEAPREPKLFS